MRAPGLVQGRGMRQRAVAVAVAALLVAGLVGVAVVGPEDRLPAGHRVTALRRGSPAAAGTSSTTGGSNTTAPVATAPPSPAVDQLVARLERYVEQQRGLRFKQPVKVTLLDDAVFQKRSADAAKLDKADADRIGKVLRALHMLAPGVDYAQAYQSLYTAAVIGAYDPKAKELFLRGADTDRPEVREVLVHELTHAVQDQNFGISRPELDKKEDDSALGFLTVVEGDAVRIQQRFHQSLSKDDQRRVDAYMAAQSSSATAGVPQFLVESLSFPYVVGPAFTTRLVQVGGQARLDEAFRHPPTTTAQLLHPDLFLAGEGPRPVARPDAGGPVIDHNVIGELGLLLLLEGSDSSVAVVRAAAGWGGDQYVAWDAAGGTACVRADIVMDTGRDADDLLAALGRWAEGKSGVTIAGRSPIVLTSCG